MGTYVEKMAFADFLLLLNRAHNLFHVMALYFVMKNQGYARHLDSKKNVILFFGDATGT